MARRDLDTALWLTAPTAGAAAPAPTDTLATALQEGLDRLRRVALRITRDASAADDVVQSAAEKALRSRAGFRGDAKPSTWLHRIVVNEALLWLRSESRRRARGARCAEPGWLDGGDPAASPLDALLAEERRAALRRALGTLRSEDADLLAHSAREGDYESWARRAGIEATAAKTRAFRARRALRAALEASERPEGRPQQQVPSAQGSRVSR